jgi:hypothetical protein
METTDFGERDDRPTGCSANRSVIRAVFLEAEVGASAVVVEDVGGEDAPEMRLVQDDHVIEDTRVASIRSGARRTGSATDSPEPR